MRRREFIAGLGSAAASSAWAHETWAQQAQTIRRIGVLMSTATPVLGRPFVTALQKGLSQEGFDEGRNVAFEFRWAEGHYERLPSLATELVRRQVAVLVTMGNSPAALAAKAATQTIPIVFAIGADPTKIGLVSNLARPTENITGVTIISRELLPKRLEIVHGLMPSVSYVGVLINPTTPNATADTRELEAAARILGLRLLVLEATNRSEIEKAFDVASRERVGALTMQGDSLYFFASDLLVALSARHLLPTIYHVREAVDAGGLMSYGARIFDSYRIAGTYVGRILKGEKPAELPVQQSSRFELVINMKTAKALGLTIPETLLATADEVIQ